MRVYAAVFAVSGAAFVAAPGLVTWGLNLLAFAPGARPLPNCEPTYWLALTGSMMAMIAYLAWSLAEYPDQPLAWSTLLLSKGMSTALFAVFALQSRNTLFLAGSAVDGSIFLHLLYLRPRGAKPRPAYEVWFAKLNDEAAEKALWVRYTRLERGSGVESDCWYVLFDSAARAVTSGRWPAGGAIAPGRMTAEHDGVSWSLDWSESGAPSFDFVPRSLTSLGLAGTEYVSSPLARFRGSFRAEGRELRFEDAPGSVGHLWGRRMGERWRWAHAVLADEAGKPVVFELLSARAKWGPASSPQLTTAHLWLDGRHLASAGLLEAWSNRVEDESGGFRFSVRFGELLAEGTCSTDPGMTADLLYDSPDGRRLRCLNSKTGRLRLKLTEPSGRTRSFESAGAAAVERVEPAA
jgi:hypothetical protein